MQINEQTHVIYTFKLTVAEALILKQMVQNKTREDESLEVEQFRLAIWNYLPAIENLTKGSLSCKSN